MMHVIEDIADITITTHEPLWQSIKMWLVRILAKDLVVILNAKITVDTHGGGIKVIEPDGFFIACNTFDVPGRVTIERGPTRQKMKGGAVNK